MEGDLALSSHRGGVRGEVRGASGSSCLLPWGEEVVLSVCPQFDWPPLCTAVRVRNLAPGVVQGQ